MGVIHKFLAWFIKYVITMHTYESDMQIFMCEMKEHKDNSTLGLYMRRKIDEMADI